MSSLGNGISEVNYTVLSESPKQNQFPLFIDDKRGSKENHFYSLLFGQAETSIY